jgi:uncharacterized membrane protein YoaK (UPF0700 family)
MPTPWLYLLVTAIAAIFCGFIVNSRGRWFQTLPGIALQSSIALLCFFLIGFAFYQYNWKIGLLTILVVFVAGKAGRALLEKARR